MKKEYSPEALEALKDSIHKWERIVAGEWEDMGGDNCALCKRFHGCKHETDGICPVVRASLSRGCANTPWLKWGVHGRSIHKDNLYSGGFKVYPDCPVCKELAQDELDFLKSLLPTNTEE